MERNLQQTGELLEFGEFALDLENHQLSRNGQPVPVFPKAFKLLAYLAEHSGQLIRRDDLLKIVWPDTHVEKSNLTRYVSYLRKALGDEREAIIETVPKLGYRFAAPVTRVQISPPAGGEHLETSAGPISLAPEEPPQVAVRATDQSIRSASRFSNGRTRFLAIAGVTTSLAVALVGVNAFQQEQADIIQAAEDKPVLAHPSPVAAKEEIRRVLRESQVYESLVAYRNPDELNLGELENLFVPASLGGRSAQSIEAAVKRQLERGYRYSADSRLEVFDILFVRVYPPGDYAEARTRERWYLPVVREDGTRVVERNPFLGPYEVAYTLRKIDGRWLVQSATTPYVK